MGLRTQLTTDPESRHPYRASGLVPWPILRVGERLLCTPVPSSGQHDSATKPRGGQATQELAEPSPGLTADISRKEGRGEAGSD